MSTSSIVNSTYKSRPINRRDLVDYFPVTTKFYPGYVKMAIFREKMKAIIMAASVCDNSRDALLNFVDCTDWRPEDLTAKLQAELRKKATEHRRAAEQDAAMQIVGGKAVKKLSKYAKAGITKVSANPKINAKLGKAINNLTVDYQTKNIVLGKIKVKSKTYELTTNIIDVNPVELGVDKAMNATLEASEGMIAKKTGWAMPNGFEVSINNEDTRRWITKYGISESVASWTLEVADLLSDIFPVSSWTKAAESFFANYYLSFRYWNDARMMEETRKFFEKKWNEITSKLKEYIKNDLKTLSNKEFSNLSALLLN